jgi:hypothetical protein
MLDLMFKLQQEYGKNYLSYSSIKLALEDMQKWEDKMRGMKFPETPALRFGKLHDCMVLTPEEFDSRYVVLDDSEILADIGGKAPRRTKAYTTWVDEQTIGGDLEIVTAEEYTTVQRMLLRLQTTGVYDEVLKGSKQEEFNDVFIGDVPVRGFLDVLGDGYITDLKTTDNLSKFRYKVKDFGYDIQAYMYCEVFGVNTFHWVAQEKKEPYSVGWFTASEETLEWGKRKFNKAVRIIREYLESGKACDSYFVRDTI